MQQLKDRKELEQYITESIDRDILKTNWILLGRTKHGDLYDPQSGEVFTEKDDTMVELSFRFLNLGDIE